VAATFVFFASCQSLSTSGGMEHGRLAIAYMNPTVAVVAADSRGTLPDGSYRDDACKIMFRGMVTMTETGRVYPQIASFDGYDAQFNSVTSSQDLLLVTTRWTTEIKSGYDAALPTKENRKTLVQKDGLPFAEFTFLTFDKQRALIVAVTSFFYNPEKDTKVAVVYPDNSHIGAWLLHSSGDGQRALGSRSTIYQRISEGTFPKPISRALHRYSTRLPPRCSTYG
jgi:hypothetical protein